VEKCQGREFQTTLLAYVGVCCVFQRDKVCFSASRKYFKGKDGKKNTSLKTRTSFNLVIVTQELRGFFFE